MIYLIGGPPRCGKTTLAKAMSKKYRISWISADTLESVSSAYISKQEWKRTRPYSILRGKNRDNDMFYTAHSASKIVRVLIKQAHSVFAAIDMAVACEIANGNDFIIEGYHLEPSFVHGLIKKYGRKNIRAIFLTKHDKIKFAKDVHKSTTPNDWLLVLTKQPETFVKVGAMIDLYSRHFEKEAKKYGLTALAMDIDFEDHLHIAMKYLRV